MNQIETFLDKNDRPMGFRILGKFSVDDIDYVATEPVINLEPLVYIPRIDPDQNGQKYLVGIGDDELTVAQKAYEELINQEE